MPAPIPPPGAPWREVEVWLASIAGPRGDDRSIDELAAIARQVQAGMRAATTADLRTTSYFYWRSARWNDGDDSEAVLVIQGALDELRRRGEAAANGCS